MKFRLFIPSFSLLIRRRAIRARRMMAARFSSSTRLHQGQHQAVLHVADFVHGLVFGRQVVDVPRQRRRRLGQRLPERQRLADADGGGEDDRAPSRPPPGPC